jgi:hypothetical protein
MAWDDDIPWNPSTPLYAENPPVYTDPYEEGYQGGDSDGSAGSPTNPNDPAFDASGFDFSKLSSGALDVIKQLASSLGMVKNGQIDFASLMPILALLGGGINTSNATSTAANQVADGAREASKLATEQIGSGGANGGGARAGYAPFMAAGQPALAKMVEQINNPSNLAAQFLSKGTPSTLADQFKAGGVNLRTLAKG